LMRQSSPADERMERANRLLATISVVPVNRRKRERPKSSSHLKGQ
jgi:hypothetical protein